MTIPILATIIRLWWIVFEYAYLRRHRIKPARDWDRHSAKLWDAANLIEPIGMLLGFTSIGRIQTATNIIGSFGLTLLVVGIIIRAAAVWTLGKYFTSTVVSKNDH